MKLRHVRNTENITLCGVKLTRKALPEGGPMCGVCADRLLAQAKELQRQLNGYGDVVKLFAVTAANALCPEKPKTDVPKSKKKK